MIDINSSELLATICFALIATAAASARAADPIIGTWKLNIEESTFSTAMQEVPPRELTEVLREVEGGHIELTQNGMQEDGTLVKFRIAYPVQGGVAAIIEAEGVEGLTFVETLVSPGNWYATTLQGGEQIIVRHKVVSADGQTKRETVHGTDASGQPFEQIEVYERIPE